MMDLAMCGEDGWENLPGIKGTPEHFKSYRSSVREPRPVIVEMIGAKTWVLRGGTCITARSIRCGWPILLSALWMSNPDASGREFKLR